MSSPTIETVSTRDARFQLAPGEGSDAVHRDPEYSYAVTLLGTDAGLTGSGLAFTLGAGNDWVCRAAEHLARGLVGQEIEQVMADFGRWQNRMANDHQLRWLGPHKGVVHLALASVTNACFDLWAKSRSVPLWRLLLDLLPEQLMATLDLSYLEDVLTPDQALALLHEEWLNRSARQTILTSGYPGYDTSVGWFNYSDEAIRENCEQAVASGFTALKLKVGSADPERDLRRARIVRQAAGDDVRLMLDANQQWTLPQALRICPQFSGLNPYWIEEPTHPDDILGHQTLAHAIQPVKIALGEHVPNRVLFKNYLQMGCAGFIQVDAVRVAGISEFLAVSLLCRKFGVPVVPHVGDMGQIHQHLVLFNHIGLGHEALFLEYIPHLQAHFMQPAQVRNGRYVTPQAPGSSSDLMPTEAGRSS